MNAVDRLSSQSLSNCCPLILAVHHAYRYRADPSASVAQEAQRHINICRQVYNHSLYSINHEYDDCPNMTTLRSQLPDWKQRWPEWGDVYSKTLQTVVERLYHNLDGLKALKERGYDVGKLQWKGPSEYRSITFNQSGFDVDENTGRDGWATVEFSKLGTTPIRYHRPIPENADIKEVILKKEKTGDWFVSVAIETDDEDLSEKPALDELDVSNSVGIDLGILNYIHTSDGLTVDTLDFENEYERLRKAQRTQSRREEGSQNWEQARRRVASVRRRIRQKVLDFQHKLTTWLCREYDAVFVEDLDVKVMMEDSHNARNKQDAAWRQFITLLEYKADLYGCYVQQVPAPGTTKECASCGIEVEKELWVREHSCPSCGFETDRDANAALNVLQRGFSELGLGWPEDTPVTP